MRTDRSIKRKLRRSFPQVKFKLSQGIISWIGGPGTEEVRETLGKFGYAGLDHSIPRLPRKRGRKAREKAELPTGTSVLIGRRNETGVVIGLTREKREETVKSYQIYMDQGGLGDFKAKRVRC